VTVPPGGRRSEGPPGSGDRDPALADPAASHAAAGLLAKIRLLPGIHPDDGLHGTDVVPEKLIPLKCHPYGQDQHRYGADPDRHVHQQQVAGGHSSDENRDCDND
jgi:hypothetical protein